MVATAVTELLRFALALQEHSENSYYSSEDKLTLYSKQATPNSSTFSIGRSVCTMHKLNMCALALLSVSAVQ